MYLSVCVFLQNIEVVARVPFFCTSTSRKAIFPSSSFSMVNWMVGFWEFRCPRNSSRDWVSRGQMEKTSSDPEGGSPEGGF